MHGPIFCSWISRAARSGTFSSKLRQLVWECAPTLAGASGIAHQVEKHREASATAEASFSYTPGG